MRHVSILWLFVSILIASSEARSNLGCLRKCNTAAIGDCDIYCENLNTGNSGTRRLQDNPDGNPGSPPTDQTTDAPTPKPTPQPTPQPTPEPTFDPTVSPTSSPTQEAELSLLDFVEEHQWYFMGGLAFLSFSLLAVVLTVRRVKTKRERNLFNLDVRPLVAPDYLPETIAPENDPNEHLNAFQRILPSVSKKFKRAGHYLPKNFWGSAKMNHQSTVDGTEVVDNETVVSSSRPPVKSDGTIQSENIWGRFSSAFGRRKNRESEKSTASTSNYMITRRFRRKKPRKSENPTLDMFMPQINQIDEALKESGRSNGRINSSITVNTQDI